MDRSSMQKMNKETMALTVTVDHIVTEHFMQNVYE